MGDLRSLAYGIISNLPAKVASGIAMVAALWPVGNPESFKAWWDWAMTPEQIRIWGIVLIVVTLTYWVVLALLKPDEAKPVASSSILSTAGPQSPSIQTNYGPITFGQSAVASNPDPPKGMDIHPHAVIEAKGLPDSKADVPLMYVLARVYKKLGGTPSDPRAKAPFFERVDREIAKGVQEYRMSVWGFYGKRGPELLSMRTLASGWFDHKKEQFISPGDSVQPMRYEHLGFNREQVERAWPK